jgi:gliding-associated putative ABC transporter substrate-binding component GldG
MVKPSLSFTDEEKLKLDQYVMRGGKLLLFIDRLNAEMDSLQQKNEVVAYERDLKLNDLIFRYGARINPDLLMDLQCDYLPFDVNGNGQFELLPWNYFPVFESASNHPINKNLGFVSGQFVNTIDTTEAEGIRKTVLLRSSVNARKIGAPALISGRENVTAPESEKFRTANLIAGVLLEGKFNSFFANRLSKAMNDSLEAYDYGFIPKCVEDNKMVIVGDGDILLNAVVKGNQPIAMGMNPFTFGSQREFPFANREFLLNTLEYLVNNNGLAEAKSKDYVVRLLDSKKVEAEKTKWQIINIAVPVLLLICFALLFQWIRKRKYSKP